MKKLFTILLLTTSSLAFAGPAHHTHGHWHRGHNGHWQWAPFIIGAATGAVIYDIYNRPVVVQQPPVVVQQPSIVVQQPQTCSVWTETQHPDGTITRTRTCSQ
jgi:hypothetical protein